MFSRSVPGVLSVLLVSVALTTAPAHSRSPIPSGPLADSQHECLEPVPESASVKGVSDNGDVIELHTLVLLDGVPKKLGKTTMATAQESYEPLALSLRPTYKKVVLTDDGIEEGMDDRPGPTGDAFRLIAEAQKLLGGARPAGIDLVIVLTDKDIYFFQDGQRNYGIGGMAKCIGGIRYDEHAFAVSEAISPYVDIFGDHIPGLFAAHELAHLLGAHHHYGNCGEGDPNGAPCTIMMPTRLELVSPRFGTLESATMRGHAVDHTSR